MDASRRRREREPVAYIVGWKGFRRLDLQVDRRVLIPRPETEHVVEAALSLPAGARVVDVGTGSGAIALALKDERPDLEVFATDVSNDALDVARANAPRLGLDVTFVFGNLTAGLEVDAVVSNPPYVEQRRRADARGRPLRAAARALRRHRRPGRDPAAGARRARAVPRARARRGPGRRDRRSWRAWRVHRSSASATSAGIERVLVGEAMTDDQARALGACVAAGGVAVFPADTVYGLACDPENADAVAKLYALKGRPPGSRPR